MKNILFYLMLVPFVSFSQVQVADQSTAAVQQTDSVKSQAESPYSVTLNTSYKQNRYASFNNDINIVYEFKKWKINSSIAHGYENSFWENDRETFYPDITFIGKKRSRAKSNGLTTFIDVQYQISDKTKINVYTGNDISSGVLTSYDGINMYTNANAFAGNYTGDRRMDSDSNRNTVNVLLRHDFESPNKYFTVEGDWLHKAGSYDQHTYGQNYTFNGVAVPDYPYSVFTDGDFDFDVYALNALFNAPVKWFDFAIGGKVVLADLNFDANFSRKFLDVIRYPQFSPVTRYKENRQSVFTDFKKTLGKWEFQTVLKFENTVINGNVSDIAKKDIDHNYFNFLPSVSAKYSFDEGNNINFSYDKSISRPSFRFLNPAIGVYNEYENYRGDPFMKPSLWDNLSLVYTFKSKYNIGFSYSKVKDNIGGLATFNTDHVIRHRLANYFDLQTYQLTANASVTVLKFIETSAQLQGFYKANESQIPAINNNYIWGWYGMLNNQLTLNKAKTLTANLNFWYKSKTNEGEFLFQERYAMDLGMQVALPKQNLTINFNVTDALRSLNEYAESTVDNINQKFRNYWEPRSFKISATYKFGNSKLYYNARTAENVNDDYR
ncbi:outer membrane beta-barrel family protein [Flavobacterium poyangense]|uniref:outer membrane beta-barrel family protein n=1 Tax=Flavobacterium poyangense TaxID=2204302 RepID=UPI0014245867|nr:outer membrane beta-barrel family protein [Flavobacterium sp. JXAS1]